MPNMSYCRFENTLIDLEDCFGEIDEKTIPELHEELSEREYRKAIELIKLCKEIAEQFDEKDLF